MTTIKSITNVIDSIDNLYKSKAWETMERLARVERAVNDAASMGISITMPTEVAGTREMMDALMKARDDSAREMKKRGEKAKRDAERRNTARARREERIKREQDEVRDPAPPYGKVTWANAR